MRRNNSILERCRNGERLTKTITGTRSGSPVTSYCLEPSGMHVTEGQALGLLRCGQLVPAGDGLFELSDSQTWRLEEVEHG